jgi:hypothetical protein
MLSLGGAAALRSAPGALTVHGAPAGMFAARAPQQAGALQPQDAASRRVEQIFSTSAHNMSAEGARAAAMRALRGCSCARQGTRAS